MFEDKTPILVVECDEPEGIIERKVYFLELTIENLYSFWTRAREFPTLFAQKVNEDFGMFCEMFLSKLPSGLYTAKGLLWVVDDFVGVFYITDISDSDAYVHYSFFDRRQKGRVNLVKAMLKFAFGKFGFNRLSASLPLYVKPYAFAFVKSCGFKDEGRKRKARYFKGEYFDESLFGILREEVLNG